MTEFMPTRREVTKAKDDAEMIIWHLYAARLNDSHGDAHCGDAHRRQAMELSVATFALSQRIASRNQERTK